ncbi:MAG: PAS domain S-box protein [Anaerolineae bacterium]
MLLVVSDTQLRLHLRQLLEHEQYIVQEAATLDEISAYYEQANNVLVLIDFRMRDAIDLCRAMRARHGDALHIVGLFESSTFDEPFYKALESSVVDEIIPLPIYNVMLGRRIRSVLGEQHKERDDAERYRALFSRSLDAVYINDMDGNFIDANDAALNLLGYTRDELLLMNIGHVIDRMHYKRAVEIREIIAAEGFYRTQGDFRMISKEGEVIFLEANFSALYHNGQPSAVLTVARDITERKRMEIAEREQRMLAEALRDIAATLNSTLELDVVLDKVLDQLARVVPHDTASVMLFDGDMARVVRHRGFTLYGFNEAILSMRIAISEAPIIQRMIATHQPTIVADVAQDVDWIRVPTLDNLMHGYLGAPVRAEGQVIGLINVDSKTVGAFTEKDAERLQAFADQAAIAIRNARMYEAVNRYVETLQDRVDERTLQYHRTRERLDAILDNTTDAVLVTRTDGAIVQTNRVFDELFGKPQTGSTLQSIVDSIYVYILIESLKSVAIDNQPRRLEISLRCLDGTSYEADTALYPIMEQDILMPLHVVCSLRDIRQRKQMELSLLQALQREKELNELKSRFVTTVSHEFRTPLAVISIASEMLKRYSHRMTPEQRTQRLEGIETAVRNMTRLLSDTLTISRASEGRLEYKPESMDLEALCRQIIANLVETTGTTHQIEFTAQGMCSEIIGDRKLMEQMLEELLANAVKYSAEHSRVELLVNCTSEEVIIQVTDQGIGIPEGDASHIFEPFHRASNVGHAPGTGLGLAVVQEVVEVHQGKIVFDSHEGAGTTFTITLPQRVDKED